MNCDKAGGAMLSYADGKIKPVKASALARHLLKCEDCREYFIAFDEAMEETETDVLAPEGFEAGVMRRLRLLPAYETPKVSRSDILMRIFWGLSAVILGTAFYLMHFLEEEAEFVSSWPWLGTILNAFKSAEVLFNRMIDELAVIIARIGTENPAGAAGYTALFFVAVLGVLLLVIRRGERGEKLEA